MIYTLTFSPSLDYIVDLEELKIGKINRTEKEAIFPGGKGINVSLVLNNLNNKSTALGFVGGFIGKFIEQSLNLQGIKTQFIEVEENSRINVKINGTSETAINGKGPNITKKHISQLINTLNTLNSNDIVIISGTIPSNLLEGSYQKVLETLSKNNIPFIVDTSQVALFESLKYHPILVKPNKEELEELFGNAILDDASLISNAKKLLDNGALNVIVSLGEKGAILLNNNMEPLKIKAPAGKVINTVGAGDSLVAGFVDEYYKSKNIINAFKKGIACGSATAFSLNLASKQLVDELYIKINN